MLLALWLAGLVAIGVAAAIASSRARAMPGDVVGRAAPLAAAIACAGLAGSAVWVWGGAARDDGRADRLHGGAAVRVALGAITVAFDPAAPRTIAIGHADTDDVRLPGDRELARIEIAGGGVVVSPARTASHCSPATTSSRSHAAAARPPTGSRCHQVHR